MADPDIADTFQYNDEDNAFLLIPLILPQFNLEVTYPDTASEEEENGTNPQTGTADISREPDEADDDHLDQVMLAEVERTLKDTFNEQIKQNETNQEPEFEDVNIISNGRFPVINTEEKENIVDDANSKSTKKQTKYGVNIFRQWLLEREKNVDFEDLDITSLDATLREFYAEVRSTDGNFYSKSTFVGIRASINRHLRAPPFNKTYALMDKSSFSKSNQMFSVMLKKFQREGLDKAKHHPFITEGDLQKLRDSDILSIKTPKGLQRKVWFDMMKSFGRRGRENQRRFTKDTLEIKTDDRGHEFAQFAHSETTKNHRGDISDDNFEKNPRMYSTYKPDCPVQALKSYLSKRNPTTNDFFQLSRPKVDANDEIWYTSRPLGENMLNNMMKDMSKVANLSQIYTNHCVRATTINILAHAGIADREIMKITGHKCETSLSSYHADSSDKQKRKYSALLQGVDETPTSSTDNVYPSTSIGVRSTSAVACMEQPCAPSKVPLTLSASHSQTPSHSYQLNMQNNVNNLPPLYSKQFEINNSTVQIYNYQLPHSAPQ
ncbi:unnamed protein product [Mytilus edulis]|uniref:ZMYM2-like/QRICH1 C-terminal domain-containing protein n=1 Tax=Mytilus edulis TaxID=6550 RepID=A0A8S3Q3B5_MYTED|nr:unnamed protein product [Mytilus edulis]